MMDMTRTSKYIAYILRHCPQDAGIELDAHGWADVQALIEGVDRKYPLTREILEQIVAEDSKKRYSFSEDGTRIRANQGHSVRVDVEMEELEPAQYLYHGTASRFADAIRREGLKPQSRLHVHLSSDIHTAVKVGSRHGRPVVFAVAAKDMYDQGYRFFRSENGVWLTDHVPAQFLSDVEEAEAFASEA